MNDTQAPASTVQAWAVFDSAGVMQYDGISSSENCAWGALRDADKPLMSVSIFKPAMIRQGYTCRQVHISDEAAPVRELSDEPSSELFDKLFDAYNVTYHGGDQMDDVCGRIRALYKLIAAATRPPESTVKEKS